MASYAREPSKKTKRSGVPCMAPGCTNYYYANSSVHYHRLPLNDAARLKQWLQVMKLKAVPDVRFSRVCSCHFLDTDYVFKGKFNCDGSYFREKTNQLTDTACPSQIDFSCYCIQGTDRPTAPVSNSTLSGRSHRVQRRNERQVCNHSFCRL